MRERERDRERQREIFKVDQQKKDNLKFGTK